MKKIFLISVLILCQGVLFASSSGNIKITVHVSKDFDISFDSDSVDFPNMLPGETKSNNLNLHITAAEGNRHWGLMLAGTDLINTVTGATIPITYLQYSINDSIWQVIPDSGTLIHQSIPSEENGTITNLTIGLETQIPGNAQSGDYSGTVIISLSEIKK